MANVCIVHCCEAKNQNIKELKDEMWGRILKCAAVYLDKPKSKYYSLSKALPKVKSGGYHPSCYQRFTSIPSSSTTAYAAPTSSLSSDIHPETASTSATVSTEGMSSRSTSPT